MKGETMNYNSIILPIDIAHPELADSMFEKAKALLNEGGTVHAVYAMPDVPGFVNSELPGDYVKAAGAKAEAALKEIVANSGVTVTTEILSGQAPRAILAVAEKVGADLIVVASHRPGLSDYLLGSTAARIVRHAQCSVLVIR